MSKRVFCFIDDSEYEISLFREVFPKAAPHLTFVTASTVAACEAKLCRDGAEPSLFILDLYGSSGATVRPIPEKSELERRTQSFVTLDEIYHGLDECRDEVRANEFLKRLFAIVNQWRELFGEQCEALAQSRKYGVGNLKAVKDRYPGTPAVVYTRKGIFPDAIELQQLACDGIFVKPAGRDDTEILERTKAEAPRLLAAWETIVHAGVPGARVGSGTVPR